ncbi:MAG: hypothetical protein ACK5LM_04550 [Lactovum sp.]
MSVQSVSTQTGVSPEEQKIQALQMSIMNLQVSYFAAIQEGNTEQASKIKDQISEKQEKLAAAQGQAPSAEGTNLQVQEAAKSEDHADKKTIQTGKTPVQEDLVSFEVRSTMIDKKNKEEKEQNVTNEASQVEIVNEKPATLYVNEVY